MNICGVLGIGNPGSKYQNTRHNAGQWLLDHWISRQGESAKESSKLPGHYCKIQASQGTTLHCLFSSTYMNHSGRAAAALANYYDIAPHQLLVIHDELDLPVGRARFKHGGGSGGHNGLADIAKALGTPNFWRLRIGIGRPLGESETIDYVLGKPSQSERASIDESMVHALGTLDEFCGGDQQHAIKHLHSST